LIITLGRWKVSFESVLENGSCHKASGFLHLWPNNWLALVNHKDSPLVGKSLYEGEVFYPGSSIRFPSYLVFVQDCLLSPPGFSSFSEPPPLRWRVTFSPVGKMDVKIPMGRSGFLLLKPMANRLILVDPKEQIISARFLHQDEHINIGSVLDINDHSVLVGECIGSPSSSHKVVSSPSKTQEFNKSRSFAQVVKSSVAPKPSFLPDAPLVRWKASCSSFQAYGKTDYSG
jgi:hypothetical protein